MNIWPFSKWNRQTERAILAYLKVARCATGRTINFHCIGNVWPVRWGVWKTYWSLSSLVGKGLVDVRGFPYDFDDRAEGAWLVYSLKNLSRDLRIARPEPV